MRTHSDIACGPFEIVEAVGEGGMGTVFRARHATDRQEVALKVLLPERTRDPEYQRAFRSEVQALARLNHPGIATIYDYGLVDAELAAEGPEAFVEGAPWLAMQFVDGAPLGEAAGNWGWSELESCLLTLLDALAHAHAHDVIHRDLKPSNLIVPEGSLRPRIVDFGIAAVFDELETSETGELQTDARGTPEYMAPEQILGKTRDHGPPTDLYAVGCLVWQLLCGEPPFEGETAQETLDSQLFDMPSGFDPAVRVPSGLRNWLGGLLAKRPWTRYRRAADAAWGLIQLGRPAGAQGRVRGSAPDAEPLESGPYPTLGTLKIASSESPHTTIQETRPLGDAIDPPIDYLAEDSPVPTNLRPPVPESWARNESDDVRPLSASGLELFGLRRIPMADRREERNIMWEALRRVDRSGSPACLLLKGPAGSGKSKLARWLARRSEELGAATGLKAAHSPSGGPGEGLTPMILRHFRLDDLPRDEAVQPLGDRLTRLGVDESTAVFDADGICVSSERADPEGSLAEGFRHPRERRLAFRRVLAAIAGIRPVVLWLDDIPWGPSSARFVEFLFGEDFEGRLPILVVMTARDSDWSNRTDVRSTLEPIVTDDAGEELEVAPLADADQRLVIERLLQFAPSVVEELVDRSEGRPLFAIQLVNDWVSRDLLHVTDEGFSLRDPDAIRIPDDLKELWERRIAQTLVHFPEERREFVARALELAATLGKQVDPHEWREALEVASLTPPDDLVDLLVESGLAEWTSSGWRFVHGLLVDALESRSEQHGRLAEHHRHCAQALHRAYPHQRIETAERRAEHWIEGRRPKRALAPLLLNIRTARNRGNYEHQKRLLRRRSAVIEKLELENDHRARVENAIEEGLAHIHSGSPNDAEPPLSWARDVATAQESQELLGRAMYGIAYVHDQNGQGEKALEALDEAQNAFAQLPNRRELAHCLLLRAHVVRRLTQQYDRARELSLTAKDLLDNIDDPPGKMRATLLECTSLLSMREYDSSRELGEELLHTATDHRNRYYQARALNVLGEIARKRGEYRLAQKRYDRAEAGFDACDSSDRSIPAMNAAFVSLQKGEVGPARQRFRELLQNHRDSGKTILLSYCYLGLAACAASAANWNRCTLHFRNASENLKSHDFREPEHAELAELGGDFALENRETDHAIAFYQLAVDVWRGLDRDDEVERLSLRVEGLKSS